MFVLEVAAERWDFTQDEVTAVKADLFEAARRVLDQRWPKPERLEEGRRVLVRTSHYVMDRTIADRVPWDAPVEVAAKPN